MRIIYELAAVAGADPDTRTLRELVWMSDAVLDERWSRLADLKAFVHNCIAKRPRPPSDFNSRQQARQPEQKRRRRGISVAELKAAIDGNGGRHV